MLRVTFSNTSLEDEAALLLAAEELAALEEAAEDELAAAEDELAAADELAAELAAVELAAVELAALSLLAADELATVGAHAANGITQPRAATSNIDFLNFICSPFNNLSFLFFPCPDRDKTNGRSTRLYSLTPPRLTPAAKYF